MTKLHDIELPDEVVEVLQQFIMNSHDDDILSYAQYGNKALLKGLRPTKENAEEIKQRFVRRIGAGKKTSKDDAGFLERHNPFSFFDGLELQTITTNLDGLCASLGCHKVAATLVLSSRVELQELAGKLISGEYAIKEISSEEAEKFASSTFQSYLPFMLQLQKIFGDDSDDEQEEDSLPEPAEKNAAQSKAEEECTRLKEKLDQVKKDLKGHKKKASKAEELEKKLSRSEKKREELKEKVSELEAALEESQSSYSGLKEVFEAAVKDDVHSILHRWIDAPENVEAEVAENSSDLVDRARALIERQQQVDRNSGNRRELRGRLEELRALRDQLQSLAVEAINPLPDLVDMISGLVKEIDRIKKILDIEEDPSLFAQRFVEQISLAESPDELFEFKQLMGKLRMADVIDPAQTRCLAEHCDRRMDLVYDKYIPDVSVVPQRMDPIYRLKQSLVQNHELVWLLDGHNILLDPSNPFGEIASEEAKHALVEILVALVTASPSVQVQLVLDSPDYSEYSPASNLKVIYSGGTGDHKADTVICNHLEYCKHIASKIPALVTSNDRDLRDQAAELGAELMLVDEFFVLARLAM